MKYRRTYKIMKTQCKTDLRSELFKLSSENRYELRSSLIIILSRFHPPLVKASFDHPFCTPSFSRVTHAPLYFFTGRRLRASRDNEQLSPFLPSISLSAIFVSYKVPSSEKQKKRKRKAIIHRFSTFVYFFLLFFFFFFFLFLLLIGEKIPFFGRIGSESAVKCKKERLSRTGRYVVGQARFGLRLYYRLLAINRFRFHNIRQEQGNSRYSVTFIVPPTNRSFST